jgi:hypothetical protein
MTVEARCEEIINERADRLGRHVCRLKQTVQQGRRELGDRSVPLGYVAGRRAIENATGGLFQHPAHQYGQGRQ